jgi:hypothetical protein
MKSIPDAPSPLRAILLGGLLCGTLDSTAAIVVYGIMGLSPMRLLQGIASGLLGRSAFVDGWSAVFAGFILEFVIATGAAAIYVMAAGFLGFLTRRPAIAGPLYGIAVYWFMQLVVLPLSRYAHRPFSLELTLIGIAIHMVCVGPPIAFAASRYVAYQPAASSRAKNPG